MNVRIALITAWVLVSVVALYDFIFPAELPLALTVACGCLSLLGVAAQAFMAILKKGRVFQRRLLQATLYSGGLLFALVVMVFFVARHDSTFYASSKDVSLLDESLRRSLHESSAAVELIYFGSKKDRPQFQRLAHQIEQISSTWRAQFVDFLLNPTQAQTYGVTASGVLLAKTQQGVYRAQGLSRAALRQLLSHIKNPSKHRLCVLGRTLKPGLMQRLSQAGMQVRSYNSDAQFADMVQVCDSLWPETSQSVAPKLIQDILNSKLGLVLTLKAPFFDGQTIAAGVHEVWAQALLNWGLRLPKALVVDAGNRQRGIDPTVILAASSHIGGAEVVLPLVRPLLLSAEQKQSGRWQELLATKQDAGRWAEMDLENMRQGRAQRDSLDIVGSLALAVKGTLGKNKQRPVVAFGNDVFFEDQLLRYPANREFFVGSLQKALLKMSDAAPARSFQGRYVVFSSAQTRLFVVICLLLMPAIFWWVPLRRRTRLRKRTTGLVSSP